MRIEMKSNMEDFVHCFGHWGDLFMYLTLLKDLQGNAIWFVCVLSPGKPQQTLETPNKNPKHTYKTQEHLETPKNNPARP